MAERVKELNCRVTCPFMINPNNHMGVRPCVKEIRRGQEFCIKSIQDNLANLGYPEVSFDSQNNSLPHFPSNRLEIFENGLKIGRVANGTIHTRKT